MSELLRKIGIARQFVVVKAIVDRGRPVCGVGIAKQSGLEQPGGENCLTELASWKEVLTELASWKKCSQNWHRGRPSRDWHRDRLELLMEFASWEAFRGIRIPVGLDCLGVYTAEEKNLPTGFYPVGEKK